MAQNNDHLLAALVYLDDDVLKGILEHIINTGDYPDGVTFGQLCSILETLSDALWKKDQNLFMGIYKLIVENPKYNKVPE